MALLLTALFLVSCDRLEGQLNITKELSLVNSKGDSHLLKIGTYSADLRESTFGKKIVLRLKNDADEKFNFTIPNGSKIPTNGTFKLFANDIGQNVDLAGIVSTTYIDSETREAYQSCSYTEPYTVCAPTGPNGQVSCQTGMRTVYGTQWTRFFDRTTQQNINMSILVANSSEESAQFLGSAAFVQRIIVSQTACR